MKYKQIYSESRILQDQRGYVAHCVDIYYPDRLEDIPQGALALIRFATQVIDKLENIRWHMVRADSEAQVIRRAIIEFDAMEVKA